MFLQRHWFLAVSIALVCAQRPKMALAGMPSALPLDFQLVFRLNQEPHERLQAISFFLVGVVASALVVQLLWNYLRRDFSQLPRLSYLRALSVVVLWGLLFVIVLAMISGARELMTPGAWRKQGLTYTLDAITPQDETEASLRNTPRAP